MTKDAELRRASFMVSVKEWDDHDDESARGDPLLTIHDTRDGAKREVGLNHQHEMKPGYSGNTSHYRNSIIENKRAFYCSAVVVAESVAAILFTGAFSDVSRPPHCEVYVPLVGPCPGRSCPDSRGVFNYYHADCGGLLDVSPQGRLRCSTCPEGADLSQMRVACPSHKSDYLEGGPQSLLRFSKFFAALAKTEEQLAWCKDLGLSTSRFV